MLKYVPFDGLIKHHQKSAFWIAKIHWRVSPIMSIWWIPWDMCVMPRWGMIMTLHRLRDITTIGGRHSRREVTTYIICYMLDLVWLVNHAHMWLNLIRYESNLISSRWLSMFIPCGIIGWIKFIHVSNWLKQNSTITNEVPYAWQVSLLNNWHIHIN